MNDLNESGKLQVQERAQAALVVVKSKWGLISKLLVTGLFVGLVVLGVLTVQRARDATQIKKENEALQKALDATTGDFINAQDMLENTQSELTATQEQLAFAENQVELLEDSTDALIGQVGQLEHKVSELEKWLAIIDKPSVITRKQLEEQLTSLSELVTAKYFYRNAARREASKTWLWGWTMPFSDTSLLAAYDGTIKAGIDFSAIKVTVDEAQRTIIVILPESKITDNNIPQETINVLEVKDSLFSEITFNDYNQFISAEKKAMEEKAIEQGLLKEADEEAKAIITAFLKQIPGMNSYKLIVQ